MPALGGHQSLEARARISAASRRQARRFIAPSFTDTEFWGSVDFSQPRGCWLYAGAGSGYGQTRQRVGGTNRANRIAFFLTYGYWPRLALHTCDNPPCVRPSHLYDGSRADNVRDAVVRGRARGRCSAPKES